MNPVAVGIVPDKLVDRRVVQPGFGVGRFPARECAEEENPGLGSLLAEQVEYLPDPLGDIRSSRATEALIRNFDGLTERHRELAIEALLREPDRVRALLDALDQGEISPELLTGAHRETLASMEDASLRARAERILERAGKALPDL